MRYVRAMLVLVAMAGCLLDDPVRDDDHWSVGFIAPSGLEGEEAFDGARLGALEAARVGSLIGKTLELHIERANGATATLRAARLLHSRGVSAIIGGFDIESCRGLAAWAESERALFINVGCPADELRGNGSHTFHVAPSESMYAAAAHGAPASLEGLEAVAWHRDLSRYGAAQLNDRFLQELEAPATPAKWSSWMAMKIVWESLVRVRDPSPVAIARHLANGADFDGHKGEPLGFEPGVQQLRQPLYLVGPDGTLLEQPGGSQNPTAHLPLASDVPLDGGPYLFVSNEGSEDVTIIDPRALVAVARVPMQARPRGIHASPDGRHVFVALSDDAPTAENDTDALVAIAAATGRVTSTHRVGSDPEQFGISPDGGHLYAANEDAGTASIIDLSSGDNLAALIVGIEPEGVAVSPDGRWVYVTAETSNTVSVIDTERRAVVASFLVDVRPRGVAFSPTLPRAYVTNEISGTLSVIDTERHEVLASVPLDEDRAKPVGVAVSPDGTRIYVANGHAHTLTVLDGITHHVVRVIQVGRRPWGVAVSHDGRRVFTANGISNDVSVVDAETLAVVATIPVGNRPWGVAVVP